jgi:O-antigen ligase
MMSAVHKQGASLTSEQTNASTVTRWLHVWVVLGMVWLVLGLAVLPAGASYSPGKLFQHGLVLTLFLPSLALLVMRPRRFIGFWHQPLIPWVVLLLAWGCVTLFWGHALRPADEIGQNVSILLFLFAWQQCLSGDLLLLRRFLTGCALGLAVVAAVAVVLGLLHPEPDQRLVGFGAMANANLAAGAMGGALMWLWPWRFASKGWQLLKWATIAVLGAFVLLTLTRSALAAVFAALVVVALCSGGRRAWVYAGLLVALGLVCAAIGAHFLMARGWSMRPQIFELSKQMFLQHPFTGIGQGTPFHMTAGDMVLTHAHNMFSQLAIELGLPGLLLWTGIWLALGWRAWRHRHETMGVVVLGLWVFGTVMVQFDLPHLLDSPRPAWLLTWLPLALGMSLGRDTAKGAAETP